MNPLYLHGYDIKLRVGKLESRSELQVIGGREHGSQRNTYLFQPRRIPYDSIIIDGHSGNISLQACHWLSKNNIPVLVMNYDGEIISSILPPAPIKADLRIAQIQAANDPQRTHTIAHAFVKAKIARTLQILEWLSERYDIEEEENMAKHEAMKLSKVSTVVKLRTVEAHVALRYWEAYRKVLSKSSSSTLSFQNRSTKTRPSNATDPVNLALNYGYGFLKGECRMAINAVGLESAVGFLHDTGGYQTKESLVYDLQEPFRWLVDLSVMQAFEDGSLKPSDFYFTSDDYRYGFELYAKLRFINILREGFNSSINYNGRFLKWGTVIQQKTNELARYLIGRSPSVDFSEPAPILERPDNSIIREKILSLTKSEASRRGIGKSTLHYLRRNARNQRSFRMYSNVKEKIVS